MVTVTSEQERSLPLSIPTTLNHTEPTAGYSLMSSYLTITRKKYCSSFHSRK